jgi:hypothetical protein
MADNTQKMSYQAGEAKGQAQVSLCISFTILLLFLYINQCVMLYNISSLFVSGEGQ